MSKVKTFSQLVAGDILWFVNPRDKRIMPMTVKRLEECPTPGYTNILVFRVDEEISKKVYEDPEQIPTWRFIKIRKDDSSVIVIIPGKTVTETLPIAIFTSKTKLKEWISQSNVPIIQMKK